MASTISKDSDKELEKIAHSAEPYPDDSPEMETLDGDYDIDRALATIAKKILDGKI